MASNRESTQDELVEQEPRECFACLGSGFIDDPDDYHNHEGLAGNGISELVLSRAVR